TGVQTCALPIFDTVVLDKTGTLTQGRMRVERAVPAEGETAEEVLELAAAVEARSEHPIARAIAAAGAAQGSPAATGAASTPGAEHASPAVDGAARGSAGDGDARGAEADAVRVGADGGLVGSLEVRDFVSGAGVGVSGVVRRAHSGLELARRVQVGRPSDRKGVV